MDKGGGGVAQSIVAKCDARHNLWQLDIDTPSKNPNGLGGIIL